MKRRFILYRRKLGGTFYVEDTETRKQGEFGHEGPRRGHVPAQRPQRIRPPATTESPHRQGIPGGNGFGRVNADVAKRTGRHRRNQERSTQDAGSVPQKKRLWT